MGNFWRRTTGAIQGYILVILVPLTLIIYLLRGLEILSWMSGGVIVLLLGLTVVVVISYGLERTR